METRILELVAELTELGKGGGSKIFVGGFKQKKKNLELKELTNGAWSIIEQITIHLGHRRPPRSMTLGFYQNLLKQAVVTCSETELVAA